MKLSPIKKDDIINKIDNVSREAYIVIKGKPEDFMITFFVGKFGNIRSVPKIPSPLWDIVNNSYLLGSIKHVETLVYDLSNTFTDTKNKDLALQKKKDV